MAKGEKAKKERTGDEDKKQKKKKEAKEGKADGAGKDGRQRKGRKSVTFSDAYPFDPAYRDGCVSDALKCMFDGLELHIKEKALYPRFVAHAVARTVAQMVQMVCYSHVEYMKSWRVEGSAGDEWETCEELNLPPIDTWARAVIPMKLSSVPVTFLKPLKADEGQFQSSVRPRVDLEATDAPRPLRRASDTNILARKVGRKCGHCSMFDKKEASRRATDTPESMEKRKKRMLAGVRKRLSSLFRDQAMLTKILKERGINTHRSDSDVDKYKGHGAWFETY